MMSKILHCRVIFCSKLQRPSVPSTIYSRLTVIRFLEVSKFGAGAPLIKREWETSVHLWRRYSDVKLLLLGIKFRQSENA